MRLGQMVEDMGHVSVFFLHFDNSVFCCLIFPTHCYSSTVLTVALCLSVLLTVTSRSYLKTAIHIELVLVW